MFDYFHTVLHIHNNHHQIWHHQIVHPRKGIETIDFHNIRNFDNIGLIVANYWDQVNST